jgi:hypothetical protein
MKDNEDVFLLACKRGQKDVVELLLLISKDTDINTNDKVSVGSNFFISDTSFRGRALL